MTTETPQTKLATKHSALVKARKKLAGYLREQDLLGEKIASAQEAVTKGESELETIQELSAEYETLQKEDKVLADRMQEILSEYDKIEWSPDLKPEEKIENNKEYPVLAQKRRTLAARLTEIPKEINKVYYRR